MYSFASDKPPTHQHTLTRTVLFPTLEVVPHAPRPLPSPIPPLPPQLGCPVGRSFFHVMRCDAAVGGGFAPDHGVSARPRERAGGMSVRRGGGARGGARWDRMGEGTEGEGQGMG